MSSLSNAFLSVHFVHSFLSVHFVQRWKECIRTMTSCSTIVTTLILFVPVLAASAAMCALMQMSWGAVEAVIASRNTFGVGYLLVSLLRRYAISVFTLLPYFSVHYCSR